MNSNRKTFNSLPIEIIREILCYTGIKDLYNWKSVCSRWNNIIQEILNIQEIPISAEDRSSIELFSSDAVLKFYQAPFIIQDLINEKVISDRIESRLYSMECISFDKVIGKLEIAIEKRAQDKRLRITGLQMTAIAWRVVCAMAGKNSGLESSSYRTLERQDVESFYTRFRWYMYETFSCSFSDGDGVLGFVVQNPDLRTFAILHRFDIVVYEEPDIDWFTDLYKAIQSINENKH